MKRFLMCEPQFFDVCYVINPWMEGNQGRVDRALARRQWQNLHDIVAGLAQVTLIEPVAGLPDMVFTANAGLVHGDDAVIATFRHAERRPEEKHFERFFAAQGYQVKHLAQGTVFEGAGDGLFDMRGRLWLASGFRSDPHALGEIRALLGVEAHALALADPRWYHLDTCFCPLPQGQAIAYEQAFAAESVAALKSAFGAGILWIAEADARDFACNAVSIGQTLIMHRASAGLKSALAQRGFEVVEADVSEFLKAGGACKCLTLEI
ncbi:MAG TPA: arginine deiminase-related protein [Gallionella sp.]